MAIEEKYFISKIVIDGLFGDRTPVEMELTRLINCIHGANGSGKTTIINLLVAALSCDVRRLGLINFEAISVFTSRASNKRSSRFFTVKKIDANDGRTATVRYDIPGAFKLGVKKGADGNMIFDAAQIRQIIDTRIPINYLPLNRLHDVDPAVNSRELELLSRNVRHAPDDSRELGVFSDPIRRMLIGLERKFKDEYSKKQREIRGNLEALKDKVLEKLLIDESLVSKVSETQLRKLDVTKNDYKAAKEKLDGIGLKIPNEKLETHFAAMIKASETVFTKRNEYIAMKDNPLSDPAKVTGLLTVYSTALRIYRSLDPIHNRFMSIISEVEKSTDYRIGALKIFKDFEESINTFLVNKTFEFSEAGEFKFICRGSLVKLEDLSSGEKHILALLGKVALNPETSSIFIADEPELSLHLSWQRKLLPAINKICPDMQIIVATHAPAIIPASARKINLDVLNHDPSAI